ncbi:hypothetical protein QM012_000953 [Aureobasidium pullulans]|uniref:BTB domain-containing protein n=1 Tax=Aureobasidium pullulans TaxID=5580 RepID=A0ABR0TF99_AURPU
MSSSPSIQTSSRGQSQKALRETRNQGTFFSDKTFSDVIVKSGDHEIFAHKVILESEQSVIDLGSDDDPAAVTAMLRFFYDGTYRLDGLDGNPTDQHLTMYRLADFYDAPDLRKEASYQLVSKLKAPSSWVDPGQYNLSNQTIRSIQQILGPSAGAFADNTIQEDAFEFAIEKAGTLYKNVLFKKLLGDGDMFNEEFARRFAQEIGELICRLESMVPQTDVSIPYTKPSYLDRGMIPVTEKRNLFDDEELSDCVIKFGNKQIFGHKAILANGSVWFEKAFLGGFSEANKKVIELHDKTDPDTIVAMLEHLYGLTYRKQEIPCSEGSSAGFHLEVFMLADKYDIGSLRLQAAARFISFTKKEYRQGGIENGVLRDRTIYALQKSLGPKAVQLADQSLSKWAEEFVLKESVGLFSDVTFRELMGQGLMLNGDLGAKFLEEVFDQYHADDDGVSDYD